MAEPEGLFRPHVSAFRCVLNGVYGVKPFSIENGSYFLALSSRMCMSVWGRDTWR
jgi:hypothetical protein